MAKSVIGFDIGASALKIVQWNGSNITHALSVPTPENLVKNGQIASYEGMTQIIKDVVKAGKFTAKNCAVILPASHAFLRSITLPAMTVDQLAVNLPYEFRDFLNDDKDKYYYDYAVNEIINGEDGNPVEMVLTACAVQKSVIESYRTMFRQAGLHLVTAIPVEAAYSNLISHQDPDSKRELCIVDLGYTSTRIHFYKGRVFETTRALDTSLQLLDQAVADATNVDEHIAHTYVQTNHSDVQHLDEPMRIYQSVAMDTRKTVNFYGFNHRDSDLQDAWCIGGGIQIQPLLEAIEQTLDLNIHTSERLIPPAVEGLPQLNSYAAAIGAAIQ